MNIQDIVALHEANIISIEEARKLLSKVGAYKDYVKLVEDKVFILKD